MSGALAAAQSVGCCCRPAPNVGCSLQLLRPWICGQDERWNELAVSVSGRVAFSRQQIPVMTPNGIPCFCYGGTFIGSSVVPSFFLSKSTTPSFPGPCSFAWGLRNSIVVGEHSSTISDCYTQGSVCCYLNDPWPCNGFCSTGPFISQRTAVGPICGFTEDTVSICGNCPNGPWQYARRTYLPAPGPVILEYATLGIESGFTISQCGAPAAGTPVQWVLSIDARPYYTCEGQRVFGGAAGYSLRYVKRCCNYLEGPVGTYTLQGDTNQGYTQQTECDITQLTAQFSPTATVTEV